MTAQGRPVSSWTVGRLLRAAGYSLQEDMKVRECAAYAVRDAQFLHLNEQVVNHQQVGAPVVSVDPKKQELWASEGRRDPRPVLDGRFVGVMA